MPYLSEVVAAKALLLMVKQAASDERGNRGVSRGQRKDGKGKRAKERGQRKEGKEKRAKKRGQRQF